MKTFKDLKFEKQQDFLDGIQAQMMFENDFGVSVIRNKLSYGGKSGLYEVGILDSLKRLTYDTRITSDTVGWLTGKQVSRLMQRVQNLKSLT